MEVWGCGVFCHSVYTDLHRKRVIYLTKVDGTTNSDSTRMRSVRSLEQLAPTQNGALWYSYTVSAYCPIGRFMNKSDGVEIIRSFLSIDSQNRNRWCDRLGTGFVKAGAGPGSIFLPGQSPSCRINNASIPSDTSQKGNNYCFDNHVGMATISSFDTTGFLRLFLVFTIGPV